MQRCTRDEFLENLVSLGPTSVVRRDMEAFAPTLTVLFERYPDAQALVCFTNMDFWASAFGRQTVMVVGPSCTYKTVQEVEGQHLHDQPSQRQYPTHWVAAEDFHAGTA